MSWVLCLFIDSHVFERLGAEEEVELHLPFYSQMNTRAMAGPGQRQEPRTPPGSPVKVADAPRLEPASVTSQEARAGVEVLDST